MARQVFSEGEIPAWIRRIVTRERRRLCLEHWTVCLALRDQEWLREQSGTESAFVYGVAISDSIYQIIALHLAKDMTRNAESIAAIRHELNHARYQIVLDVLNHAYRVRPKLTRAQIITRVQEVIEGLCEHDCEIYERAYGTE